MSGKDDYIFKKTNLLKTISGRKIIKKGILKDKGYQQFKKYAESSKKEYNDFVLRFQRGVYILMKSDSSPIATHDKFIKEVGGGSDDLRLDSQDFDMVKAKLMNDNNSLLADRIKRILNSNFVKMTFPVFHSLYDGYVSFKGEPSLLELRNSVVEGHLIAIDLSEPMDRIVDKDEDVDYLDDYKFMNPYILAIARINIAQGGDAVLKAFEEGFRNARIGQHIDLKLKMEPASINDENMTECYKKYRAVMGTAGRNMALNRRPLSDIFHLGMAKAGECVGCGNEIEDAIRNNEVKVPSWPLYFTVNTGSAQSGFELTMAKSDLYLDEAKIALDMLPENFQIKPFLEFLFLTVRHYNQYWYNELVRHAPFGEFYKKIEEALARRR